MHREIERRLLDEPKILGLILVQEMPRNTTLSEGNARRASINSGISMRHGLTQEAKKSITTHLALGGGNGVQDFLAGNGTGFLGKGLAPGGQGQGQGKAKRTYTQGRPPNESDRRCASRHARGRFNPKAGGRASLF